MAKKKRIVIINYGLGNLHSVHKALLLVADGWQVDVGESSEDITTADKIVFPGVGAIGACMQGLYNRQLVEPLIEAATHKPFLAICVGFQALFADNEEEANVRGLGILSGRVRRFPNPDHGEYTVPHMGWNSICQKDRSSLWKGIDNYSYMYFAHSYFVEPKNSSIISATCNYGRNFAAMCIKDQLIGCQFHPEKSHANGLQLLRNFVLEL